MKNRYLKQIKISEIKFRDIFRYFTEDFDLTKTSLLSGEERKEEYGWKGDEYTIQRMNLHWERIIINRIEKFFELNEKKDVKM